jgi:arylsulfatase A-like enzyme
MVTHQMNTHPLSILQKMKPLFAIALAILLSAWCSRAAEPPPAPAAKPNVLVILTDDQGYGDFSCHGNPVLKTPALDQLHDQSLRLTDFHVAPICTPTRSQLMTGRDCLATGAYCVCSGHEFVRTNLPTMADVFAAAGYRTALFGKWHLGDNYPYRPQDRGFQEVLTFGGYGLVSASTYWDSEYMDPWLRRNGRWERAQGYCTDVFFAEAMKWMKDCAQKRRPFFLYLPLNVPHGPFQVPAAYRQLYAKAKLGPGVAGFFGMIANLDENIARCEAFLKENGLYDNTIVIFMTDNGGTGGVKLYNAGMRGEKGTYYDGGHRVPCFIRWPAGGLRAPADVDTLTQNQDLLPSLIELCGLTKPPGATFDGRSLAPLLRGQEAKAFDERMCVVQCALWSEYEHANKWAGTVLWNKWRLVKGAELYNVQTDPGQKTNVLAQYPDIAAKMCAHYENWWSHIEPAMREFQPIHLGSQQEPVTVLTSHNWVAPNTSDQASVRRGVNQSGPWHVWVERAGPYEISLRRWPEEAALPIAAPAPPYHGKLADYPAGAALPIARARLKIAAIDETKPVPQGDVVTFPVTLPVGPTTLQTWFSSTNENQLCGAYYVYIRRAPASTSEPLRKEK